MDIERLQELRAAGVRRVVVVDGDIVEAEFYEMTPNERMTEAIGMSKSDRAWASHLTGKDKDEIAEKVHEELVYGASV